MSKQRKESPRGPEQLALEDIDVIKDSDSSAKQVQARKKGRFEKCATTHVRDDGAEIPNVGPMAAIVATSQSRDRAVTSFEFNSVPDIPFKNAPHVVWVYADHARKCDMVCVAVPMISGVRKVDFFLSEDNVTLTVAYLWPSAIYSPEELFHSELNGDDPWAMNHPKIHAFMSRLLECKLTERSHPVGSIVIKLPMKVLRETNTYTKAGIKTKDGLVVMLEFQAFQKNHIIEQEDRSITFK